MKLTTYAQSLNDLNRLKNEGLSEVILEPREFSRFGKLSGEDFRKMSQRCRELNLRIILEWDILMTEDVFQKKTQEIINYLPLVDAVRVQDPGALQWLLTNTKIPLQFIAENGNHNLESLKGWLDLGVGRLERLILSIELTRTSIEKYVKELKVPCELLGFGRILLFYTPRGLLSAMESDKIAQNQEILAIGESEESPHKGFPIVENQHGTFMFHIKEFCLLEYVSELQKAGLSFFRIDQRWSNFSGEVIKLATNFSVGEFEKFKSKYPEDLMRGFYLVNKTDVLFPKLKNNRLQNRDGNYLGEVVEAQKGSHLAILVKNSKGLEKSQKLRIVHPKGEVFEMNIYSLRNISLNEVEKICQDEIALTQFMGGVWVKSQVFYQD